MFRKCADLTGQDLILAHPSKGEMSEHETNLAYIRFAPMGDAAVEEWTSEQPNEETKVFIANYDGGNFGAMGRLHPRRFATLGKQGRRVLSEGSPEASGWRGYGAGVLCTIGWMKRARKDERNGNMVHLLSVVLAPHESKRFSTATPPIPF